MRGALRLAAAGLLLGGCVAGLVAVGGKLTVAEQGFEVGLPQGWYRFEQRTDVVVITRDGAPLQAIRIGRGDIDKALPHTKRKLTRAMPPVEAAEVVLDNARSDPAVSAFELIESAPATVGGRPGFRLLYAWKSKDGLRRKRLSYAFLEGGWMYYLVYDGAARHYFDRDLATFEKVRESFRLTGRPT